MGEVDYIQHMKDLLDLSGEFEFMNLSAFNLSDLFTSETNLTRNDADSFKTALVWMNIHITPVIIIIGIIGNMLSFLVFFLTHLRRLSSSLYLSALALADLGFLGALCIVWMERVGVVLFTREGWCPSVIYMTKICGFVAVWSVVSFTSERYIMVYHSLRKDTLCTHNKAKMVILVMCAIPLVMYIYVFFTYGVIHFGGKAVCSPLPRHYNVMTIMTCIDTVFACVVPSIVIIMLNIRIIIKIHHYQKWRSEIITLQRCESNHHSGIHTSLSTTGSMRIKFTRRPENNRPSSCPTTTIMANNPRAQKSRIMKSRSQYRTARMLLILSSVFVSLNLPSHIFQVLAFLHHLLGGSATRSKRQRNWQELFQLVYFLNFAISIFIYSACGHQFRTGLRHLWKRMRHSVHKCGQIISHTARRRNRQRQIMLDVLNVDRYNGRITQP